MKVKVNEFIGFLSKIRTNELINSCILRFEKDTIKIDAKEPSSVIALYGEVKTSIFKDYEAIGNIGIANIKNVIEKLQSLRAEEIDMTYNKDNAFEIIWKNNGVGSGSTILKDIESLDDVKLDKIRELKFYSKIEVESSEISRLEKQFELNDTEICKFKIGNYENKDGVKVSSFVIHFGRDFDKDSVISQEYFYLILKQLSKEEIIEDYYYSVGKMLIDIMKTIGGKFYFNLSKDTNYPLVLSCKDDNMKFNYVIAKTEE